MKKLFGVVVCLMFCFFLVGCDTAKKTVGRSKSWPFIICTKVDKKTYSIDELVPIKIQFANSAQNFDESAKIEYSSYVFYLVVTIRDKRNTYEKNVYEGVVDSAYFIESEYSVKENLLRIGYNFKASVALDIDFSDFEFNEGKISATLSFGTIDEKTEEIVYIHEIGARLSFRIKDNKVKFVRRL